MPHFLLEQLFHFKEAIYNPFSAIQAWFPLKTKALWCICQKSPDANRLMLSYFSWEFKHESLLFQSTFCFFFLPLTALYKLNSPLLCLWSILQISQAEGEMITTGSALERSALFNVFFMWFLKRKKNKIKCMHSSILATRDSISAKSDWETRILKILNTWRRGKNLWIVGHEDPMCIRTD